MAIETESRRALHELIDTLKEVDARWSGEEWNLNSPQDVALSHRAIMHYLEAGLVLFHESDPSRPDFRRIVTRTRKFLGDNPDAVYFDAAVSPDYSYSIRGNIHGAVYFSLTTEKGTEMGGMHTETVGVLNDTSMKIEADGSFEVVLGGEPRERNWLPLEEGVSRITTRHYFENETPAAADPRCEPRMTIETLDPGPPPAAPNDASIAAGIRRVAEFVRSRTLGLEPMARRKEQPTFVSIVPNAFPEPVTPGDFGLSAADAHYSMAPYFIGPEEALVMTGRWPSCRCANVVLWNRFMQTFDYANRRIGLNRKQTVLEADGSFRMIIAHEDPGMPNWLDTEGNMLGLVFWRFMLAEGEVETPQAEVVKLADL
jgi:hypothetical protein